MTAKEVYEYGKSLSNEYYRLRDICYSAESNDMFDEEHDNLYYQYVGIEETLFELVVEYEEGELSPEELEGYLKEFKDNEKVINNLKKWLKATNKFKKGFNYLYG